MRDGNNNDIKNNNDNNYVNLIQKNSHDRPQD